MSTATLLIAPTSAFAYGPGGGGGNGGPPGFGDTVTADNVGAGGGVLKGDVQDCHVRVKVPKGTFKKKTNVVISKITIGAAQNHLDNNTRAICAFGVGFFRHGHTVRVHHGHPSVGLHVTGSPIHAGDKLRVLIPGDGSRKKHADVTDGNVVSKLRATHELAVVRHH